MQLEFPFVIQFAAADWAALYEKRAWEAVFKKLMDVPLDESIGKWARELYRSGGIFIYKEEPQLVFPHSDYWGFEECEP